MKDLKLWGIFISLIIVVQALGFFVFSGIARHIKPGSSPYGLVSFSHQHLQFRTDLPVHYHSHLPPLFPPYPGPGPCFRTGICRKF